MLKKKYKDDYKVSPKLDHKGRMINDYYYVGQYYKLDFEAKDKKRTNIWNIIYTLLFLTFWMFAGLINTDSSRTFWVLFPYYFILLPIIYFGYGAINYWTLPVRMERMAYDTSIGRMRRSGLGIIIWTAVNIVLDIIYMILNYENVNIGKEIIYTLCLAGIVVVGIVYSKFYNRCYTKITID